MFFTIGPCTIKGTNDEVVGAGISGSANIIGKDVTHVYNIYPQALNIESLFTQKNLFDKAGNTTFLTIQRFNEILSITAAYFPDDGNPFSAAFPTFFMYIDENAVKRRIRYSISYHLFSPL
jgi:hypothetical protein